MAKIGTTIAIIEAKKAKKCLFVKSYHYKSILSVASISHCLELLISGSSFSNAFDPS